LALWVVDLFEGILNTLFPSSIGAIEAIFLGEFAENKTFQASVGTP
jgi:hypothetical protein